MYNTFNNYLSNYDEITKLKYLSKCICRNFYHNFLVVFPIIL